MRPYLVYKTWIDLDHVMAIRADVEPVDLGVREPVLVATAELTMAFSNKAVLVRLSPELKDESTDEFNLRMTEARQMLAELLAAWKGQWWCKSHRRAATHKRPDGTFCCDPNLGGIMLPCNVALAVERAGGERA